MTPIRLLAPTVLAFLISVGSAYADIRVYDQKHKGEESKTSDTTDNINQTNEKIYTSSESITCATYRSARGPQSAASANPKIVGLVKRIAREEGVNEALFVSLVYQESRFNPCAKSPVGAYGLAQLMPGTAKDLGVNPHNIEQNLRGGARYLKQQLRRFGSVPKALAAYNAGPGNVLKYGGIPPFKETQGYVRNITTKWLPVFGGGSLDSIPEFRGGGNSIKKSIDSTFKQGGQIAATADSHSDVASWLQQQISQGGSGTIQDAWDTNTGTRASNIGMLNKFLELGVAIVDLRNSLNSRTTSSISGSGGSLDVPDDEPNDDDVVGGVCPNPNQRWDDQVNGCVEDLLGGNTFLTSGGQCTTESENWDEEAQACVVFFDPLRPITLNTQNID